MTQDKPTNQEIAEVLDRIADLLEAQGANPFRVRAYADGAAQVRASKESLADMVLAGGEPALTRLPGIGPALAGVINEYVKAGRSTLLVRLQTEMMPAAVFAEIPGLGPDLAQRIVDELGVRTLEELEQAAHDGRLDRVPGFGPQRVRLVQTSLAGIFARAWRRPRRQQAAAERPRPSVELLLEVDAEYRERAEAGDLRKIAPRRFNPGDEAWLPVLETERDGWRLTALYSNTARAHELGKTDDWVVIYYEREDQRAQATVVTGSGGPLDGRRVVRGREDEIRTYYERRSP